MRVAIVSDIHGNLLALEAVLEDIAKRGVDEIWCGGDIAWAGPRARECVALVRDAGWPAVRGNTDVWVAGDPQTIEDPERRAEMARLAEAHELTEEEVLWLVGLPLGHSGEGSLLLVHGTPVSPFDGPEPDAPAAAFDPFKGQADIVVYGHVHRAFTRRLVDGTIVCNPGSVGRSKDGSAATYLLVERVGSEWVLRPRAVSYDVDSAIAEARRRRDLVGDAFLEHFGLGS